MLSLNVNFTQILSYESDCLGRWIPKVGKVALMERVSVLDEVKEKGCLARERERV